MTRILFALFAVCLIALPVSVSAQEAVAVESKVEAEVKSDDATKDQAESPDDYEAKLKLSKEMHEIWPIRSRMERALDAISKRAPEARQQVFKTEMRKMIDFKALEQASVDAMVDIFTVGELEAMIAFYGSKEGRSIDYKKGDYENALEPVMQKMVDKAVLNTKLGN